MVIGKSKPKKELDTSGLISPVSPENRARKP